MMYISVYQLIKQNIEQNTPIGDKLRISKKAKQLNLECDLKDEFLEEDYSSTHFELDDVMELVAQTIKQKRTNEKYILLEGLCNSKKLVNDEDKMALRFMDELFRIEKKLGEVVGIIGLQYFVENEFIREDELVYEVFPEPEVVEVVKKPKGEDDEDEEEEEPEPDADDDDGEPKQPAFKVEDYKWTISDRNPKSLPVLYV